MISHNYFLSNDSREKIHWCNIKGRIGIIFDANQLYFLPDIISSGFIFPKGMPLLLLVARLNLLQIHRERRLFDLVFLAANYRPDQADRQQNNIPQSCHP